MKGFKNRTSKFGSLFSLLVLSVMIMLFAVNFPMFIGSVAGRTFASIWAGFAITMVATHVVRLSAEHRQRPVIILPGKKDARTRKSNRRVRAMGG